MKSKCQMWVRKVLQQEGTGWSNLVFHMTNHHTNETKHPKQRRTGSILCLAINWKQCFLAGLGSVGADTFCIRSNIVHSKNDKMKKWYTIN